MTESHRRAADHRSTSLPQETVDALQRALATEHAAVWVYGLVSAFLPNTVSGPLEDGMRTHTTRRDEATRMLKDAGAEPRPAEAAYLTPQPVTDRASALTALTVAETDAAAAWRSVLEHTIDATARRAGLDWLTDCAVRSTRWRLFAGQRPAAAALPGGV
ncbi:MAG: ferritin-like domain-containing protein [Kutzneria sp.]|nr:ferritin-like domain-containing protein [Kutzneria sp.]MBV9845415.1 ferritin-like domain-containing protein [Kutzneria sp.]